MILLDSANKALEVVLAGPVTTSQLPFVVTCTDGDASVQGSPVVWMGTFPGYTNGATAVALAPSPVSSALRKVRQILLQNADTVAAVATIRVNDNGFFSSKFVVTLQPGDHFHYIEGAPVKVFDKNGNTKQNWGGVTSISNVDGTLTISPTTGAAVASIALGHANTWTATQTFQPSSGSAIITETSGGAVGATINSSAQFTNSQTQTNAEAFGAGATVAASSQTVIGQGATADSSSTNATVIGQFAKAVSGTGIAIGAGAQCKASSAICIGNSASVTGASAVVIGTSGACSVANGVNVGNSNTVSGAASQAFGAGNTANAVFTLVLGNGNSAAGNVGCCVIGQGLTGSRAREYVFGSDSGSGAGASSAGNRFRMMALASDNVLYNIGIINFTWLSNTAATRKGAISLVPTDFNALNPAVIQVQSDGVSAGGLAGFFGTTPVVQQTGDIGDALSTYGLCTSPSLKVANGGTGDSSFTAYAVVCGGTGSTTALQSVAALGSAGDVLTSNGAGALPTFQTPTSILRRALAVSVTTTSGTMANLVHLGLTVASSTRYTGILVLIANNTVATDGIQVDFNGGTATVTNFSAGFIGTPPNAGIVYGTITTTALGTALTITTASTGNAYYMIAITVLINAGGTFIPRWSAVAPTTGTASAITGSWIGLDTTTNG